MGWWPVETTRIFPYRNQFCLQDSLKPKNDPALHVWAIYQIFLFFICSLDWLPVVDRMAYKLSTLIYFAISGTSPRYLSELTPIYMPAWCLCSSSDIKLLNVLLNRTKTYQQRVFYYQAPSTWNRFSHQPSLLLFSYHLLVQLFRTWLWPCPDHDRV